MNHTTTVVDLNTIAASFPGMCYAMLLCVVYTVHCYTTTNSMLKYSSSIYKFKNYKYIKLNKFIIQT